MGANSARGAQEQPSDLEQQLELTAQVQRSLLPQKHCCFPGWEIAYEYEPAGFVSGDYLDLLPSRREGVHFALGDVSGKGIAGSMLMSNLHATLRVLLGQELPLEEVLSKTSRALCEISSSAQFATLVLGTASKDGTVEICNAGHVPVLLLGRNGVTGLTSTALPVGIFCNQAFTSEQIKVAKGDILFVHSDGLSEAENAANEQYGDRLPNLLQDSKSDDINVMLSQVLHGVHAFAGERLSDDVSVMALRHI